MSTLPSPSSALPGTPNAWLRLRARFALALQRNEFWRWWSGELREVWRDFAKRWLADEEAVTLLNFDGSAINVADETAPIRIDFGGATSDQQQSALAGALATRPRNVQIVLARRLCLVKEVVYPAATEENLRDVLSFDMDRQTPFNAAQVWFDGRVVGRDGDGENAAIRVLLVVVPRATLSALQDVLKACGAHVSAIHLHEDTVKPRLDLLPVAERPRRRLSQKQKLQLALLLVTAVFALLAILLPIWQKHEHVRALTPVVETARADAETTRKIEEELTTLLQDYNFAATRKHGATPALAVLDELTRISPDATWLRSFEMKPSPAKAGAVSGGVRDLLLSGEAASASRMIEFLEGSPLFQNASQRAQTTRGSQVGQENFQIATEVKLRPLPEKVPLGEAFGEPNVASASVAPPTTTAPGLPAAAANAPPREVP